MKMKSLLGASLFAATATFAQYSFEPTNEASSNAVASPAPVAKSASTAAASAPAASSEAFDRLRGNAYNAFGNEAAASTVGSFLASPSRFADQQFLYIEPVNNNGTVSWGKGTTYFASLDNSQAIGLFTAGLAIKNSWGLALSAGFDKTRQTTDAATTTKTNTVGAGDRLGVAFSMPYQGYAVAASADWLTFEDEVYIDAVTETSQKRWELSLDANIGNGPTGKDLFWTAGFSFFRHEESDKAGSNTATDLDSRYTIAPYYNVGLKVLGSEDARVFVGTNSELAYTVFDNITDQRTDRNSIALYTNPNILGEVALTEKWMMFGGASHRLTVFHYGAETLGTGATKIDNSALEIKTSSTQAQLGLRFNSTRFAAEAALSDALFSDGTGAIFNGNNLMATFGGFLYF